MICDLLRVRTEVDYVRFLCRNQYPFKRHKTRQRCSFPCRVLSALVKKIGATGRPPPQANRTVAAAAPRWSNSAATAMLPPCCPPRRRHAAAVTMLPPPPQHCGHCRCRRRRCHHHRCCRRRRTSTCNFFGAPKKFGDLIFIEYVFERCFYILTVTNHKSQIYNCESQTQMSFGYSPLLCPTEKLSFWCAAVSGKKSNSFLLWFVLIPKQYLFLPICWYLVPAGANATLDTTHHKYNNLSFFFYRPFPAPYIWQGGT